MNGNIALTIDNLSGVRGDLVPNDEHWQTWDFLKLRDALKSWTRRNPVDSNLGELPKCDRLPVHVYNTRQQEAKPHACVYCEDISHKTSDCPSVTTFDDRKKFLALFQLCLA